jgi:hypothetical protein
LPAPSPYLGSTAAGRETPASLSKRTGKGMAAAAGTTRALPGGLSRRRRWGEGRKAAGVRVSGCRPPIAHGERRDGPKRFRIERAC